MKPSMILTFLLLLGGCVEQLDTDNRGGPCDTEYVVKDGICQKCTSRGNCARDKIPVVFQVIKQDSFDNYHCNPRQLKPPWNVSGKTVFIAGQITNGGDLYLCPEEQQAMSRQLGYYEDNYHPNQIAMYDDGTNSDAVATDSIWTYVINLPVGAKIEYKYTYGTKTDVWFGTEEWAGNNRILQVEDVNGDGKVVLLDRFADEACNKKEMNDYLITVQDHPAAGEIHLAVSWDSDLDQDGYLESREHPDRRRCEDQGDEAEAEREFPLRNDLDPLPACL